MGWVDGFFCLDRERLCPFDSATGMNVDMGMT